MLFEGTALADAAAHAAMPQGGFFDQLLTNPVVPLVLVVAVFYFVILRPQTQRASEHQRMIKGLKRNDEVVTTGGLIGRIHELSDNLVTLEIAPNVRVRIERSQIGSISNYGKAQPKKEKSD